MKELPRTSRIPSVSSDFSSEVTNSEYESKYKDKSVKNVKPDRSTKGSAPEQGEADGPKGNLRKRDAVHLDAGSSYSGQTGSAGTESSTLTDYEEQYFRDVVKDDEESVFSGDIRRPSKDFPIPVRDGASTLTGSSGKLDSAVTDNASVTIKGGGQVHNSDPDTPAVDDASITIEGGGQVPQSAFKSMIKKLWSWAVNFARDNKVVTAVALAGLLCIVLGGPAGPAFIGAVAAGVLTGLGWAAACALAGYAIACLIGRTSLFAQPVPPPGSRPNPSPQNPDTGQQQQDPPGQNTQPEPSRPSSQASSGASTTSGSAKSARAKGHKPDSIAQSDGQFFLTPSARVSKSHKPDSVARSDGKFLLTPTEDMSRADGASAFAEAENLATKANGAEPKKTFSMAAFDQWLSEDFSAWAKRQKYAEFSGELHKSDSFQSLDSDGKLDSYFDELSQKCVKLSKLANSPLTDPPSSELTQKVRLDEFTSLFESALKTLDPSPERCQIMSSQLLRMLPKAEFPWVSSDVWSPLLSTGDGRNSLEGLSRDVLAEVEASDYLRLSLRGLNRFASKKTAERENLNGDRADPIAGGYMADGGESSSGDERSRDDGLVITEVTSDESGDESSSFDKELARDGLQQQMLSRFKRLPDFQEFDTRLPDVPRNKVNFEAFFTNIIIGVVRWHERQTGKSTGEKSTRTSDHHQMLVVNSLAKGVFEAGTRMMRETPDTIEIDTSSGRISFLGNIFASDEVDKIFAEINAKESDRTIAKDYLSQFIK